MMKRLLVPRQLVFLLLQCDLYAVMTAVTGIDYDTLAWQFCLMELLVLAEGVLGLV